MHSEVEGFIEKRSKNVGINFFRNPRTAVRLFLTVSSLPALCIFSFSRCVSLVLRGQSKAEREKQQPKCSDWLKNCFAFLVQISVQLFERETAFGMKPV